MSAPKLSANLAVLARNTIGTATPREKVLRLYRFVHQPFDARAAFSLI